MIAAKIFAKSIDFLTLAILARLLSVADFGLMAIAMTFIVIVEVVLELPIVQVLIRVSVPTDGMFDTAFTLSTLRGIALATCLITAAWPISLFYEEPRLFLLIGVLSIAPIFRGMLSPRMVIYFRRMDFRRDLILEVVGKISALFVSVSIATSGGSYWAIAAGTIVAPIAMTCLSYVFAPYRPRLNLSEWSRFSQMIGWNSASQLMTAINWQIDRLLLGRFATQEQFGQFSMATELTGIPAQVIVVPITRPLLAAFSIRSSSQAQGAAYCKASNAIFSIVSPVLLSMSLLADFFISLALGQKWLSAAPMLQYLAFSTLFSLPTAAMPSLAMSLNKAQMITFRSAVELTIKIPLTVAGIVYFGLMGAVIARSVISVMMFVVSVRVVKKLAGVPVLQQLGALWRTAASIAVMSVVILTLRQGIDGNAGLAELGVSVISVVLTSFIAYIATLAWLWRCSNYPEGIEKITYQAMRSFVARCIRK